MLAKFINFMTIKVSSSNESWLYSGKLTHSEHMLALAYLQSNFKNHIVSM